MRLIDADALINSIQTKYAEDDNITGLGMSYKEIDLYNEGIDMALQCVKKAPTINRK